MSYHQCCDCACTSHQIHACGGCPYKEPLETAPADLEEDKHNVESMGTWLIAAIGLTCVGAAIGLALGG